RRDGEAPCRAVWQKPGHGASAANKPADTSGERAGRWSGWFGLLIQHVPLLPLVALVPLAEVGCDPSRPPIPGLGNSAYPQPSSTYAHLSGGSDPDPCWESDCLTVSIRIRISSRACPKDTR